MPTEKWKLQNVAESAKRNPKTFFIPSITEINELKEGNIVKLIFDLVDPEDDDPGAERMWVIIKKTKNLLNKKYVGILDNDPIYISSLKSGDSIEFYKENIASIYIEKNSSKWFDSIEKKALVSKLCLEEGEFVRFLYRENPDNKEDSGWRLFSGKESAEYANDSQNIKIMNISYLTDIDPTLLLPFQNPIGFAFERKNKNYNWKKIEDWSPEN